MLRTIASALGLLALFALFACGLPTPRSDGEPGSGFPHTENWRFEHGPNGRENPDACYVCHDEEAETGVDYVGGERLPPCNGCHGWPLDENPETAALEISLEPGSRG